jgi:hypothetical protein
MKRFSTLAVAAGALAALYPASASLISDSFETDSSSNYTVVNDGTPNGTVNFSYNYVSAGIPLAPRSSPGDSFGLRMTVNDSAGAVDTFTAFHNTLITAPIYTFTVDVYIGFTGTAGTTEHAHVGVGGDGVTPNSLFTPISGSGSFIAFDGDGGSASDYRWYLDADNGGATTIPNTDPSYLGHGSNNTGAFYQALFPSTTVAGSPGNVWTKVEVTVDNSAKSIQYRMNDQLIFDSTPNGPYTGNLNGAISVGLHDAFTSVDPATTYVVFDNLVVTAVPEPEAYATMAGVALIGFALYRRSRKA